MDKNEQNELLADTINMVMLCLEKYQDNAVKNACRNFLNEFALSDDEYDDYEDVESDDMPDGEDFFSEADRKYEQNRDDKDSLPF